MNTENDKQELGAQLLLAEYKQIDNERLRLRNEGIQRLNFFLTLTSAVLGGIVLLGTSAGPFKIEYILLFALFFLSIIGWYTFSFTVGRDVNTDRLLRAAGRIRRFFTNNSYTIKSHLMWQDHDEPSFYITQNNSMVRKMIQATLALLLATAIGLLLGIVAKTIIISVAVGIISFLMFVILFESYAKRRFRKAVKNAEDQKIQPKSRS